MLQIFRIEHAVTGVGPYQTVDEYTQQLAKRAGRNRNLRSPGDDGLPVMFLPYSYVFGCLDIASLKRWFFLGETIEENDAIVGTLKEKGFRLAEYIVESTDCRISATGIQVAFDPSTSRDEGLVEYHDLNMLLRESPYVFCIY